MAIKAPKVEVNNTPPVADALKFKRVTDGMVNFTKRRAFEFLELETFLGERDIRQTHVQHLLNEWHSGRFHWDGVTLASCILWENIAPGAEPKKHVYRINGGHTAWMRVSIPDGAEPLKPVPNVREIVYSVENEAQLRALYSVWDQGAMRTPGHITKALLVGSDVMAGMASSNIGPLSAGFRIWRWENYNERCSKGIPSEVVALLQGQYATLFPVVARYLQIHYKDALFVKRAATVAAMFATFEKAPQDAPTFWDPVCTGLGLDVHMDPRYQLRRYMDSHGHTMQKGKDPVGQEEMFRVAVQAWNRWRKGETVSVLRTTEKRVKPV